MDVDVATLDNTGSHKEWVSRTYQGTDGYAPIFKLHRDRGGYVALRVSSRFSTLSERDAGVFKKDTRTGGCDPIGISSRLPLGRRQRRDREPTGAARSGTIFPPEEKPEERESGGMA